MSEQKQTDLSTPVTSHSKQPKAGAEAIDFYLELAGRYITELNHLYGVAQVITEETTPELISTRAGIASAIVNTSINMASLRQNLAALVSDTIHNNMRELTRNRTEGNNPPVAPPNF